MAADRRMGSRSARPLERVVAGIGLALFAAGLVACGSANQGVSANETRGIGAVVATSQTPALQGPLDSAGQVSEPIRPSYDQLLRTQRLMVEDHLLWFLEHDLTVVYFGPKDGWLLVGVRSFTPEQDLMVKRRWGSYVRLVITADDPRLLSAPYQ